MTAERVLRPLGPTTRAGLMCLILFTVPTIAAAEELGAIRGQVTTTDGIPAQPAGVIVTGTHMGAMTGPSGAFEIRDVPPGDYEVRFWCRDCLNQIRTVRVVAGQTTTIRVILESIPSSLGSDRDRMFLADRVSFGLTREQVRKELPIAMESDTDETMKAFINVSGSELEIAFNFTEDKLSAI